MYDKILVKNVHIQILKNAPTCFDLIQIIFRELICSLLKLLILKFVKNVKVHMAMQSGTHLHTESTYTHQMLCCRITIWTFTFLTNFKITNFNKEHISSLNMI